MGRRFRCRSGDIREASTALWRRVRIDVEELDDSARYDQAVLFEGNSVLRGQSPRRTS
jgi:hypothetical protein